MKLAVFVSGTGTNLVNIISKSEEGYSTSEVVLVVSNHDCEAIRVSTRAGIQTKVIDPGNFAGELEFGESLHGALKESKVDLVVLAGFLKKVPDIVVKSFPGRIINIHPALLPSFGGKGMYGMKVHQAVIDYGCRVSGATVHIVDTEYDHGPVVLQRCVQVDDGETPESLASKIHRLEYELLPEAIKLFEDNRVEVQGRKVQILPFPKGLNRT